MVKVSLATKSHLADISALVKASVVMMAEAGFPQWHTGYPTSLQFASDIEKRTLYVATHGSTVLGMATIDLDVPEEYTALPWGGSIPLLIHRLAVSPSARKLGIATTLESYACVLADSLGRDSIRLDTHVRNHLMRGFLRKAGYTQVAELEIDDMPFIAYEKAIL